MDAPSLSQPAFSNIEQDIGYWWENISEQEIQHAGAEERRIAVEKGNYHQEVPCISVIAGGGWSKKSHTHSYNALGGIAIIIGKETGKIIYAGRVADKGHRLISNTTTNLAECWMHMRTKFDGGEVYNLCNRGSWHTRCYGGSLRMNIGPQWSSFLWHTCWT